MTVDEIEKGFRLLCRWRSLHQVKAQLVAARALADLANIQNYEINVAFLEGAKARGVEKIDELIGAIHVEAKAMGISPPFPGAEP